MVIVYVLMVFLYCSREEFMHWVEMMPDTQTPSWLGLPSNAEKVLLTTQGMPQSSVLKTKIHHSSSFKAFMITQVSSLTMSLYYSSSLSLARCISSTEWYFICFRWKQTRGFFCFH